MQIPIKEEIKEYMKRVREREKAGMNTYGLETPSVSIALEMDNVIDNLKKLISSYSSIEELENAVRNAQTEDEKNRRIAYAIKIIEEYKKLDLNNNKGMKM